MRIGIGQAFLIATAALLGAASASAAPALTVLDGRWAGDGMEIRIDAERSIANIDPAKPFSWQRFIVKEVEGARVVFTVGARLFMADLSQNAMTLTGFDFPGEITLTRQPDPVPEPVTAEAPVADPEPGQAGEGQTVATPELRPTLDTEVEDADPPDTPAPPG